MVLADRVGLEGGHSPEKASFVPGRIGATLGVFAR